MEIEKDIPPIDKIYENHKKHEQNFTVKEKIKDRQEQVYILHLKGQTNQEIADDLGVSLSTIEKDLHNIKEEYKEWFNHLNQVGIYQTFRDSYEQLDQIRNELWQQYKSEKDSETKLKILNNISNLAVRKVSLLKSKPYLPTDFELEIHQNNF